MNGSSRRSSRALRAAELQIARSLVSLVTGQYVRVEWAPVSAQVIGLTEPGHPPRVLLAVHALHGVRHARVRVYSYRGDMTGSVKVRQHLDSSRRRPGDIVTFTHMRPHGGTPTAHALSELRRILEAERPAASRPSVVLVSDGQPEARGDLVERVYRQVAIEVRRIAARSWAFAALQIGDEVPIAALTEMYGSCWRVAQAIQDLPDAVAETCARLLRPSSA